MPNIEYVKKDFRGESFDLINKANAIIADYEAQGLSLTLRQLYYQFVSKALIPNTEASYDRIGNLISDARLAGYIDWDAITDRTRSLIDRLHFADPASLIDYASKSYMKDFWVGQPYRPEVWIEKNALINVIHGVCDELDVPHFATIGYNSQTAMWEAAQRLIEYRREGAEPIIMYLGDHDPSGLDMTRDVQSRLELFVGHSVRVVRLGLNYGQVQQYRPPPNPTKLQDSRAKDYIRQFGYECWELDALEPTVIISLVRDAIENMINRPTWDKVQADWKKGKEELQSMSKLWDEISHYVGMRAGGV